MQHLYFRIMNFFNFVVSFKLIYKRVLLRDNKTKISFSLAKGIHMYTISFFSIEKTLTSEDGDIQTHV